MLSGMRVTTTVSGWLTEWLSESVVVYWRWAISPRPPSGSSPPAPAPISPESRVRNDLLGQSRVRGELEPARRGKPLHGVAVAECGHPLGGAMVFARILRENTPLEAARPENPHGYTERCP